MDTYNYIPSAEHAFLDLLVKQIRHELIPVIMIVNESESGPPTMETAIKIAVVVRGRWRYTKCRAPSRFHVDYVMIEYSFVISW